MRILTYAGALAIAIVLVSGAASAHTITLGSFNAGAPGSVTIVMGTYDHAINSAEGSIQLIAGPSAPSLVTAMGNYTETKPAQLIDGVNNFFPSNTATPGEYTSPVNTTGLTEHEWQSATFTGLAPGLYTYQITGMNTVNWADWNSGNSNWTGQFEIPESSTSGVPEPASMVLMLAGFAGIAAVRRRRRKA